jgi:molecular chaperone GrpE
MADTQDSQSTPTEIDEQEAASPDLNAQIAELQNQKLQAMADLHNYRKQMEAKQATFGALTNMGLISDLLQVFDDIQMALDDQELDLNRATEALRNAQDKLAAAARQAGVERLEVKSGDEFSPQSMEAVTAVAAPDMTGKVVQVIGSGFKYANKDGVVKPTRVIVGK